MLRILRSLPAKAKVGLFFIAGGFWPQVRDWFWKAVEWLLDKAFGDAAFAWLKAEMGTLMDPVWQDALWSWGPTVLLCGAGCYLLWRGDKPKPRSSPPLNGELPGASVPTDLAPAARGSVQPISPGLPDAARRASEADWGKLYELHKYSDGGTVVRLRFLPDTRDQQDDTILLVVLGYKVMLGHDRVFAPGANYETQRALHDAPNSRISSLVKAASLVQRIAQPIPDYGDGHVDAGLLRRVGLAQGGYYELTPDGEERARMLALDLIRRA